MEHADDVKRICAEAYLNHVRSLAVKIKSLQSEIDSQRALLEDGAVSYAEKVSKSGNPKSFEEGVVELQELIEEFVTELAGYVDEQRTAHRAIRKLGKPEHIAALTGYYVQGKTWREVCAKLGYSHDGMMTLRKRAIVEVYDVMPEQWRRDPIPNAIS